jgi:predicted acylesterase/phospholipase RssA
MMPKDQERRPPSGQTTPEEDARPSARRVHLLLSSGGVRCLSYIGALIQLEQEGYEFATVSTCSAGTFIGALYCCGINPPAMREAALSFDLRQLAGDVRWKRLRRLWTLRSWPYALYREPGIPQVFMRILRDQGRNPDPTLSEMQRPLSTAAVDVAAKRLLVYSSDANPDMRASELLRIAIAIPLMYPPHRREGKEVMDAALASHTPIWLATGQREDLPIVVLRAPAPDTPTPRYGVMTWVNEVLYSGVASRDTFLLERLPRISVYDIDTGVSGFDFSLSRAQVEDLIETGRTAVADSEERRAEQSMPPSRTENDDDRAEQKAVGLYERHLDRLASGRTPTVFLSYAREDRRWVSRLRKQLGELLADVRVSVWDDSYIKPGALWDAAIEDAIKRARVAVLFISRHFLESSYIARKELAPLREKLASGQVRILWVPVDGSEPDEPEQALQAVGSPAAPLAKIGEAAADQALADLARVIEHEYRSAAATG